SRSKLRSTMTSVPPWIGTASGRSALSASASSRLLGVKTSIGLILMDGDPLGEAAKLGVADEATLRRGECLNLGEELALGLRRRGRAELFRLEADVVDARLLAEHDPPVGADERGGERLDRGRVVELARHRAGLAGEQVLADERLPGLELVAGARADELRNVSGALEPQPRVDAVQRLERKR